jgi:hypothetical protein
MLERIRELRLPRAERAAARAERMAEQQMRKERDNTESAERRAAAIEAEARRNGLGGWPSGGHFGGGGPGV